MKEKNPKNRRFLWGTLAITLVIGISVASWAARENLTGLFGRHNYQPTTPVTRSEEWVTVFVHGTFGCLLGFLSLPAVLNDSVGKTLYKSLANAKRKETSNFVDQAMLQKGLIKIQPTYDLHVTNGQHLSAYPLAQAFQDFARYCKQPRTNNTFYTFGWSGLLSQKQRRIEAVRFYNALTEELEHYHKIGRHPKVRLIAHSHGGNLCLNLAAINDILTLPSYQDVAHATSDPATNEVFAVMFEYLKKLPNKESVAKASKLKHLDYVPTAHVTIDELVLLGTPVQVETEPLFFSPTLKKIYHFYSDEDSVQALDFVSTKKTSLRRIKQTTDGLPKIFAFPELIQSKIVINRHEENEASKRAKKKKAYKQYSPSHKELWSISWHGNKNNPLSPLPVVVLTPLLIDVLSIKPTGCYDNDINIKITSKHLKIQATPHGVKATNTVIKIPLFVLDKVKINLKRWDPYHKTKG